MHPSKILSSLEIKSDDESLMALANRAFNELLLRRVPPQFAMLHNGRRPVVLEEEDLLDVDTATGQDLSATYNDYKSRLRKKGDILKNFVESNYSADLMPAMADDDISWCFFYWCFLTRLTNRNQIPMGLQLRMNRENFRSRYVGVN